MNTVESNFARKYGWCPLHDYCMSGVPCCHDVWFQDPRGRVSTRKLTALEIEELYIQAKLPLPLHYQNKIRYLLNTDI
jgi:hypothetical protein